MINIDAIETNADWLKGTGEKSYDDQHWVKAPTPTEIDKLPEVVRAADRLDPLLRRRFLEAIKAAQGRINLDDLQRALRTGNVQRVLETLRLVELEGDLKAGTSETINAGYLAGARVAADSLTSAGIAVRFDLINPHAVQWSEKQTGKLITEISRKQEDAIKDLVADSIRTGRTVQEVARSLRDMIGLHSRQVRTLNNIRARLEDQGLPEHTITDRLEREAERMLRYRANMIARTEINRAARFGQREQWDLAAKNGLFNKKEALRVWETTMDGIQCEICDDMDGQTVAYTDPWELPDGRKMIVPDVHPHCRCSESLVFE